MTNSLTAAELKRRGMAAIEEGLQHGPLLLMKRNRATAVVLSQAEYQRLLRLGAESAANTPSIALDWLLAAGSTGERDKTDIDASLAQERAW